jgi:hypothetical protein
VGRQHVDAVAGQDEAAHGGVGGHGHGHRPLARGQDDGQIAALAAAHDLARGDGFAVQDRVADDRALDDLGGIAADHLVGCGGHGGLGLGDLAVRLGRAAPLVMKAPLRASDGQGCQATSAATRRVPIGRSRLATRTWVMGLPGAGSRRGLGGRRGRFAAQRALQDHGQADGRDGGDQDDQEANGAHARAETLG